MSKRDNTSQPGQSEKVRKTLRGRAEKACVRCRAKKRTCDGGNPCLRCKESHSACYFSDWHYAVPYPREYVEYLEEQQEQLSIGILTMRRLLKEANVQTVPALPETDQAQDLLAPLRDVKLDNRQSPVRQQINAAFAVNAMPYENEDDSNSPGQLQTTGGVVDMNATSPIQPSVFPPLYGRAMSNPNSLKPPRLPPRCSSFLLPPRQSETYTMPLHPRIPNDPCPISGSSSGGGGSPAYGTCPPMTTAMTMSMPGAQWPYPSRSLPTSAAYPIPQGYRTPLTPSSGVLTTPSDNEELPNWTWMWNSEFGTSGNTDGNSGQPGDLDLDWNDVNRSPWGKS